MTRHTAGRLELICGSMFSGKTEELIRRLRRAVIAKQKVQVFKPAIDYRYHAARVTSHNGIDFEALPVSSAKEIEFALDPDTTVVAIDEVQFFDDAVVDVCDALAEDGKRSHLRRVGYGFSWRAVRAYATTNGPCRRGKKTACDLCCLW